ncbi:MAG: hypothetical protein RL701_4101 [Pseudomonadota bacterium]|jgi:hypothetical protein
MTKLSFLLTTVLCLTVACDDDPPTVPDVELKGVPVALERELLFLDAAHDSAYLLDVGETRPSSATTRIHLPPNAVVSERRSKHDAGLILCSGRRADATHDAEPATLVSVASDGKSLRYELGTTPFNTLTQSDDGRYAIIFRQGASDSRVLDNPNELVVVDLEKQPADKAAVTRKTPDGLGHTLSAVLVSPVLRIAEEDRRLLVVLSAAEVTLFDLAHLDRRATIVQLDETRLINPLQVVFSASNPTLYVRAQNSDNIFMFRLERHENDAGGNDFRPTVNPLSGGSGPRDMALFGTGSSERLMVVAEVSSQVLVIDPASSKTNSLKLPFAARKILLFKGTSPADTREQTRALLYSDAQAAVSFVDPENLGDSPEDKLETLGVAAAVTSLVPLAEDNQVLLFAGQSGILSLLNLTERTLTPISTSNQLQLNGALFDAERNRLWVGTENEPWVGTLDLGTGMTDELYLDAPIDHIVPMFEQGRIAVIHADSSGYVTLIDLDEPDRQHAISVRGFFTNRILDRGES